VGNPLTVSGDYTRTYWSRSVITNYFTLPLTPGNTATQPAAVVFPSLHFPDVFAAEQSDTQELRLGVEYVIIGGRLKLPLRAGYVREKQYRLEADGTVPSLDGVTVGAGLVLGSVLLDAAYVYQWGDFEPSDLSRSVRLHRVLVSLIYRHGAGN
jgi:long-subunit fatty acid transport protein